MLKKTTEAPVICEVCGLNPCTCVEAAPMDMETPVVPPKDLLMDTFENLGDKPNQATIDAWKTTFGEINLLALTEKEMYIYRTVNRLEFKQLSTTAKDENSFDEMLVQRCVLWPKLGVEFNMVSKGGTIGCIKEAILQTSNFLAPQVVMSLVREL